MRNEIIMFVKIFENERYRDDFLSGKLYMNRLSYFQKVEEDATANRGDRHEGALAWLQPNKILMKINDIEIKGEDFVEPIMVQMNFHKRYNVYCLYAGHIGSIEDINESASTALLEQLALDSECLKLGKFGVVIHNPKEFLRRVTSAMENTGNGGGAKLVEYYNPDEFHGHFSEQDVVFRKRDEYSHQSEYRIYIDTDTQGDEAFELEVGNIEDIAQSCDSNEINSKMAVSRKRIK
ncbi:hypothetical protein [Colwellia sp. 20A7]|uniref:hypothetical protein n=1 Tax=Colwellia sp. 20A7 TaxID=2689569 RepID=UPI0013580F0E|nr:hypothetical protein [Colwellia sp. 20A7]